MARARNIKPSFFSNDLLGELEPVDRLFFIGLWTVADYKGCVEFRPRKLKVQILPYDNCDVEEIANNLEDSGFIQLYSVNGKSYLKIPNFEKHQNPHKNERDKGSEIPDIPRKPAQASDSKGVAKNPEEIAKDPESDGTDPAESLSLNPESSTLNPDCEESAADAPPPADEKPKAKRATRIPADWTLTDDHRAECKKLRPDLLPHIDTVAAGFVDYWISAPAQKGVKTDWMAVWRNWLRKEDPPKARASPGGYQTAQDKRSARNAQIFDYENATDF